MDPKQAARAARFLEVSQVVPVHWGTFPMLTGQPEELASALEEIGAACEVVKLAPGESY
jgi:L-ascorbate metabolism protein UlaG (beta-lactamase superfamily)